MPPLSIAENFGKVLAYVLSDKRSVRLCILLVTSALNGLFLLPTMTGLSEVEIVSFVTCLVLVA